jgi:hypothetical protein
MLTAHDTYIVELQTARGNFVVRVPVDTPINALEAVVKAELMNPIRPGFQGIRREMVPDENDFLNSKT